MGPLYHGITITNYGNTRIYHSIPNHYILAFDTAECRVQTANTPFRTELIRTQITCTDSHTHKKRSDRNTCLQSIRVYGLAMQAYIDIDFPDQRIWMRRGCGLWLCSAACVRACIVCWKMIIIWSVAYRMQCVCVCVPGACLSGVDLRGNRDAALGLSMWACAYIQVASHKAACMRTCTQNRCVYNLINPLQ